MSGVAETIAGNVWLLIGSSILGAAVILAVVAGIGWLLAEVVFWWRAAHLPPQPVVVYADGTEVYEWELTP